MRSYDKHVVPKERVTDFRTFVSGVKAKHLKDGLPLRQCQNEVAAILKNKVLVGHALTNDFKVRYRNTDVSPCTRRCFRSNNLESRGRNAVIFCVSFYG